MGQEIYRLVLVDFIVFVLGGSALHVCRFLIYKLIATNHPVIASFHS